MGESHVLHVGGELAGQLPVRQPGPPGPEVHLVDGHRAAQRLPRRAGGEPFVIGPGVVRLVDDGRGGGRHLRERGHRVGLIPPGAVGPADGELVPGAGRDPGYEQLPDARTAERPHGMGSALPEVEVADEPDAARVRRPDGERGAAIALADHHGARAERVPQLLVPSLADQVQVKLAERRQVPVRVVLQLRLAVGVADLEPVVGHGPGGPGHGALEHAEVQVPHRVPAAAGQHSGDRGGERAQCPDRHAVARQRVRAEHRVRVMVLTSDKTLDLAERDRFVFR